MVLDASLLNTQHYKVQIKGEVEPSPTSWCSSYWKGSLRVTLDYGRQLYFLLIYKQDLLLNNPQWLICHKTKQFFCIKCTKDLSLSLSLNTYTYFSTYLPLEYLSPTSSQLPCYSPLFYFLDFVSSIFLLFLMFFVTVFGNRN